MPTEEEIKAFANGEMKQIPYSEIEQMQLEERLEQQFVPVEEQGQSEQVQTEAQTEVVNTQVKLTETQPAEQPQVETTEAILEKITEGKIKNTEELKALLEKANMPQEEIDPIAKSITEARKRGLDIKAWASQQLVDVNSYSNSDVALEYLIQTKGWSKEKATNYLENKYYTNEQYDDISEAPREYKIAQIELEDLAGEARKHFNSQKIDLDSFVANQPDVSQLQAEVLSYRQQQELSKQVNQKLSEYIDSSLKDFNNYSFKYTYTDTDAKEASDEVGLKLNEQQVKKGADMLKNPQLLIDALTNGGKDMDVKKLVAKINLLADDKLMSEMFADTRARSTEAYIKKLKNVGAPTIPTVNPTTYDVSDERRRIQEVLKSMPVVR
jgi:hypothetical protein